MAKMDKKNTTVAGAGVMGGGIAQVLASCGYDVIIYDVNEDQLDKAIESIENNLQKAVKKSRITKETATDTLKRINKSIELEAAIQNSDFVIEAIVENLDAKLELFANIGKYSKTDAVLASNTSQFSITRIASAATNPKQIIGMHWFNPATRMKLIEVIAGLQTSQQTIQKTVQLCESLDKKPINVKDRPGFLVNRALGAYLAECFRMLDECLSTAEEIDAAMKLGLGHPMGPFELSDLIGLDTMLNVSLEMQKVYGDHRRPSHTLRQMVAAGRLGKKAGRGFYKYKSEEEL